MDIESSFRPAYLHEADDVPHVIVDVPLWSENYLTQFYAPGAKTGFWFHLGRSWCDPKLWCEIFIAYLPGDQYLVSSSYSYGENAAGPIGNQLHYRCKKPFRQWTKSFHGAAQLVSGAQLRAGPFVIAEPLLVEMELEWNSLGPAFDLGYLGDNESWSSSHYEQHATGKGFLAYAGKRIEFSGSGIRDHSWGPRDFRKFNTHVWMNGQFPDSTTFEIFHAVDMGGRAGTHAVVGDDKGQRPATLLSPPPLITQASQFDQGYDIVLVTEAGERFEIRAEIIQAPRMTIAGKFDLLFGSHPPPSGGHCHPLFESQTRFEWNGKVGYGLTDRSIMQKNA